MADVETPQAAPARKNADLPVRIVSAIVMLAIAIGALVAGDPWLDWLIAAVVLAAFVEFVLLVVKATQNVPYRLAGILAGAAYIGLAGAALTRFPPAMIVGVVGAVIFVDTFAYFSGRTIGGPKIAPSISPSKTWAGLIGGIIGAAIWVAAWIYVVGRRTAGDATLMFDATEVGQIMVIGAVIAVAAQSGDFFESWLKRKAGVKDSSKLIPGHGGFFDRVDGMIPVVLVAAFFGVGS
ncbi:phosphatidate cytidylyltransferase [Qipengyuania zhejiangensis]|uniref:phosphatidate cytidylyltransferase n=1 Tax=Qipengyuania zhejiangensis TaxID=3077782 RepID=UPI002D7A1594|nr:phosphatidate cytidylyltransferase [Qipengyuania sp. Z2]